MGCAAGFPRVPPVANSDRASDIHFGMKSGASERCSWNSVAPPVNASGGRSFKTVRMTAPFGNCGAAAPEPGKAAEAIPAHRNLSASRRAIMTSLCLKLRQHHGKPYCFVPVHVPFPKPEISTPPFILSGASIFPVYTTFPFWSRSMASKENSIASPFTVPVSSAVPNVPL